MPKVRIAILDQEMTSSGSCPSQPSPNLSCDPSGGVVELSGSRYPDALRKLALSQPQPGPAQPSISLGRRRSPGPIKLGMTRHRESRCGSFDPTLSSLTELPFFETEEDKAEEDSVENLVQQLQAATEAFSDGRKELSCWLRRRKHLEAHLQEATEASHASAKAVEDAVEEAQRWQRLTLPKFLATVAGKGNGEGIDRMVRGRPSSEHTRAAHELRQECEQQAAELRHLERQCAEQAEAGQAAATAALESLQRQILRERVAHEDQLQALRARRAELLRSLGDTHQCEKILILDALNKSELLHMLMCYNVPCQIQRLASSQVQVASSSCRTLSPSASSMSTALSRLGEYTIPESLSQGTSSR